MVKRIMDPRIIKTEQQHRDALAEVERLAADDLAIGTPEGDRLELLAKLVEDYEKQRFAFARPDPLSAIRFRMEEQGLRQKDLAPILGGKNRVSEVLSGKRALTLGMVRALSESLHIPVELLVREPAAQYGSDKSDDDEEAIQMPTLVKSGFFLNEDVSQLTARDVVQRYLKPQRGPLYLKRTITYGATPETDKTNLRLWVGRVRELALASRKQRGSWRDGTLDEAFLAYIARLSWLERGPRLAQEFLAEKGVALVLLPVLPHTKLDGAAMLDSDGAPVIGMTLRQDRIDNFWFTLTHELVHAWKHLPEREWVITDEGIEDGAEDDAKEAEANRIARNAFIPRAAWKRSEAYLKPSVETILALAHKLQIHPAVIAGRLRKERTGYGKFSGLVGQRQVRKHFPEVTWG
jgi:HTH-type transcriptional regulator / antitoxin HigA